MLLFLHADIDYIELRSDSGLESEAEIGARRVYNYRVSARYGYLLSLFVTRLS